MFVLLLLEVVATMMMTTTVVQGFQPPPPPLLRGPIASHPGGSGGRKPQTSGEQGVFFSTMRSCRRYRRDNSEQEHGLPLLLQLLLESYKSRLRQAKRNNLPPPPPPLPLPLQDYVRNRRVELDHERRLLRLVKSLKETNDVLLDNNNENNNNDELTTTSLDSLPALLQAVLDNHPIRFVAMRHETTETELVQMIDERMERINEVIATIDAVSSHFGNRDNKEEEGIVVDVLVANVASNDGSKRQNDPMHIIDAISQRQSSWNGVESLNEVFNSTYY